MVPEIKAIQTPYSGCLFRSRLEARWAVFFDALQVAWEYEPQGFDLSSGAYLPDFWLPQFDTWWEVKGTNPWPRDLRELIDPGYPKCFRLAYDLWVASSNPVVIAFGSIQRTHHESNHVSAWTNGFTHWGPTVSGPHEDEVINAVVDKPPFTDPTAANAAYRAARSARFEFGQSGRML